MSEATLLPTHNCFDDCIEYVLLELKYGNKKALAFEIVHAICLNPHTDEPWAHAWCDTGEWIMEGYMMDGQRVWLATPKAEHEKMMRPQKTTRYKLMEWHVQNVKHGNYGPWEPEYKALCNDGDQPRAWERERIGEDKP